MLPGPLKDAVDVETKLQHAGGELCPQQSAACGLFTESGKNRFVLWTAHVHVAMLLLTTKTSALLYFCVLTVTTSLSPGVVWSGPGLALKLWLLLGELQLDHPVSPREGVLCVGLVPPHHTSTGRTKRLNGVTPEVHNGIHPSVPLLCLRTSDLKLPLLFFQPMDQSSLKNSDVLILTGLTQMPTANPDGMLGEFCSNLGKSRRTGALKRLLY